MESCAGSAFVPSSVTVFPLTATRPVVISSSALRREQIPAAAMIFCRRSKGSSRFSVKYSVLSGRLSAFGFDWSRFHTLALYQGTTLEVAEKLNFLLFRREI